MDVAEVVEHILEHHGVKGQKWGVRRDLQTSAPTASTATKSTAVKVKGLEHYSKEQGAAMTTVAKKMNSAYGLKIDEFVPLSDKEKGWALAYVSSRGAKDGNKQLHVSNDPSFKPTLDECQRLGWFAPTPKVVEGCITHEAAHSLFHQSNAEGLGTIKRITAPAPIAPVRVQAWKKAETQGRKDGDIVSKRFRPDDPQGQMGKKLSQYAGTSMWIEEHEAELFTAYHWSSNPPKFVDAFMNEIHSSMGKKVQPFSGRKVLHAT